jgi:hypothetical protein
MRPEQIGGEDEARLVLAAGVRHREREDDVERRHGPVERNDAGEAAGEKDLRRPGLAKQALGSMHHHEARDDEEQVDPGEARAPIRQRVREIEPGQEIELDMREHDPEGGERPQELDRDQLVR